MKITPDATIRPAYATDSPHDLFAKSSTVFQGVTVSELQAIYREFADAQDKNNFVVSVSPSGVLSDLIGYPTEYDLRVWIDKFNSLASLDVTV